MPRTLRLPRAPWDSRAYRCEAEPGRAPCALLAVARVDKQPSAELDPAPPPLPTSHVPPPPLRQDPQHHVGTTVQPALRCLQKRHRQVPLRLLRSATAVCRALCALSPALLL